MEEPQKEPKQPHCKKQKTVDYTLATKLEECKLLRGMLREQGRKVVRWPSPEQANVISLETLGLNHQLMCTVAEHWCQKCSTPKPPAVHFLKAQAGSKVHGSELLKIKARFGSFSAKFLASTMPWRSTTMRGRSRSSSRTA